MTPWLVTSPVEWPDAVIAPPAMNWLLEMLRLVRVIAPPAVTLPSGPTTTP